MDTQERRDDEPGAEVSPTAKTVAKIARTNLPILFARGE